MPNTNTPLINGKEELSKADKMLEKEGWIKVDSPESLKPIYNDYYSKEDSVYEYLYEGELTMRLYFIYNVYGFNNNGQYGVENNPKEHLAIHEKMKELGWI